MTRSIDSLSLSQLTKVYNHHSDAPVKKFENQEKAARRLRALLAKIEVKATDAIAAVFPEAAATEPPLPDDPDWTPADIGYGDKIEDDQRQAAKAKANRAKGTAATEAFTAKFNAPRRAKAGQPISNPVDQAKTTPAETADCACHADQKPAEPAAPTARRPVFAPFKPTGAPVTAKAEPTPIAAALAATHPTLPTQVKPTTRRTTEPSTMWIVTIERNSDGHQHTRRIEAPDREAAGIRTRALVGGPNLAGYTVVKATPEDAVLEQAKPTTTRAKLTARRAAAEAGDPALQAPAAPAKPTSTPVPTVTGKARILIADATSRPEGATSAELFTLTGWKFASWSHQMKLITKESGTQHEIRKVDGTTRYFLSGRG